MMAVEKARGLSRQPAEGSGGTLPNSIRKDEG